MKNKYLLLIILFFATACGPGADEQVRMTNTAKTTIATSWTNTPTITNTATLTQTLTPSPTVTPIPSSTFTPVPTSAPTLTPTPIGGDVPWIAFIGKNMRGELNLYVGNLYNGELQATIPVTGPVKRYGNVTISWSPTSSQLAFNSGNRQADSLRILDIQAGSVRELRKIPDGAWVEIIEWSPNGEWIAYEQCESTGNYIISSVWLINISTGNTYPVSGYLIGWAQDGSGLFHQEGLTLMKLNPDNQGEEIIKNPMYFNYFLPPLNSFFNITEDDCLSILQRDGGSEKKVCGVSFELFTQSSQVMSPDGHWLYTHTSSEQGQSYLIDLENMNVRDLSETTLWILGWTPDNTSFVAVTYQDRSKLKEWEESYQSDEQHIAKFDSLLPELLQIEIVESATGRSLYKYSFPTSILVMLKAFNWHDSYGAGISVGWPPPP